MKQATQAASAVQLAYPLFVVDDPIASREFFVRWFGFQVVFEANWFVLLSTPQDPASSVAFMQSDHPSQLPEDRERCRTAGIFITVEVSDASAEFNRLRSAGLPIYRELKDEEWGQRHFMVTEPNGLRVDVVQQIDPAPGYWDTFQTA
jgi:catechol 2,3-dioxygenase-like lactoylglutathione lyase family enzyme